MLEESIGERTGYFQIDVQPDGFFEGRPLTSAGYPSDLGIDMYTVSGRSYGVDGNVILHDLDSEPGQSGGPVWYGGSDAASVRLVGILEGSYIRFGAGEIGIAARIDRSVAEWIEQNLAAHDGLSQGGGGPADPRDPASPSPAYSLCGFGVAQALLGGSLGLLGMFVSRRRPWIGHRASCIGHRTSDNGHREKRRGSGSGENERTSSIEHRASGKNDRVPGSGGGVARR